MEERDFGWAIKQLKRGKKVARQGWNGKGMFIYLVKGQTVGASDLRNEAFDHADDADKRNDNPVKINSHIDMKAADGSIVVGWLASQTDMLSADWNVVE